MSEWFLPDRSRLRIADAFHRDVLEAIVQSHRTAEQHYPRRTDVFLKFPSDRLREVETALADLVRRGMVVTEANRADGTVIATAAGLIASPSGAEVIGVVEAVLSLLRIRIEEDGSRFRSYSTHEVAAVMATTGLGPSALPLVPIVVEVFQLSSGGSGQWLEVGDRVCTWNVPVDIHVFRAMRTWGDAYDRARRTLSRSRQCSDERASELLKAALDVDARLGLGDAISFDEVLEAGSATVPELEACVERWRARGLVRRIDDLGGFYLDQEACRGHLATMEQRARDGSQMNGGVVVVDGKHAATPDALPARRKVTIFFSWQSDRRGAACRTFIEQALVGATKEIAADDSIEVEPVIDRDTVNVPGAPDIGTTILSKIEVASVFVADVTIVGKTDAGKPAPNPNVLLELGYALGKLGWSRILLVQNTAFGAPEELPFDLRQKRAIVYSSAEMVEERSSERKSLQRKLEAALRGMLAVPATRDDVSLVMERVNKQITRDRHDYTLVTRLINKGRKRIDDWEIELQFPTSLLAGGHARKVRSDTNTTVLRLDGRELKRPLRPGEEQTLAVDFFVDNAIYEQRATHFERVARARVLVDGELTLEVERPIRELQNF